MKTKATADVIHEAPALEAYLTEYLAKAGQTFDQWVRRFGGGFYLARNRIILELARRVRRGSILEFACAGPFLAQLLMDELDGIEQYTCSNFSSTMVELCAAELRNYDRCTTALLDADVRRSPDMRADRLAGFDLFITTSLEHIQFDCELVSQLPVGASFIFSVAAFDDPEHFRVFEAPEDVEARYGHLLRIDEIRPNAEHNKFVVLATRRPNAPPDPAQRSGSGVTVIVPFRNPGGHFRPLLESIANQEVSEPAEIVAVNNLSTDGSRRVAGEVRGRLPIRVVDAPARPNGSYARNVGVRMASYDKLLFVDADDEIAPGYVQSMAAALDTREFVASRVDSVSLNDDWRKDAHGPPWEGLVKYFDFMPGAGVNVGLRRALFDRAGGFPEDFPASQDIVFCWRVQMEGVPIHLVEDAWYRYRYRESLRGLFRQTRNWGFSNVMLYRRFRAAGMPGRSLRTAVTAWAQVASGLMRARTKRELAPQVVRLGYCVGRLRGSVHFRCLYL